MVKSEAKAPQPAEYTAALLPKVEPKKKGWEKRKKKKPIAISLDPDGNPIVPAAVPGSEKSTGTVLVEVGLGNPVVDAAKCVDPIVPTPQLEEHSAALVSEAAPKKKRWEKKKKKNTNRISLDPDGNPIVPTADPGGEQSKGTVPVEMGLENPVVGFPKLIEQTVPSPIVPNKETEITVPVEVGLGNPIVDSQKSVEIVVPTPQPAEHGARPLPEAKPKKKRWEKRKRKNPIVVSIDADGNPIVDSQNPVEIIVPTPQPAEHAAVPLPEEAPEKKRWEKRKRKNPIAVSLDADGNPIVDSQKSVEIIVPALQPAEHKAALLPEAEPKKKRWEKKKKKNPIVVSLNADGNPIVDSKNSVDINEQALQPEPIGPTAVPLEVGLEIPVVDLPKSIEQTVPSNEKAITVPVEVGLGNPVVNAANIEAIVPSKKSKRKKSKTTVPGLENPVADAPEAEQTGLIPKPESIVPVTVPRTTTVPVEVGLENLVVDGPKSVESIVCSATVPSKKRKIKKSKTTVPFEVGLENPVAHAPQSIEVEQAGLVPNPEPIVSMPVPCTTIVHVQGGLENPVDLPKCIEVEHAGVLPKPEPVVPSTVPSKKRKRKKSTDNVPVDVGLENTVVDAPKPIEVDQVGLFQNLEPIVPLTVPSTTTIPVAVGLAVFDAPNFFNGTVWSPLCGSSRIYEKNNDTSTFPIDVEAREYVEICVLCRKKGHSIPTCPELNNLHVRSGGPKLEMKMREKLPPMPWGRRKRKKSSSGKEVGPL